MTWNEGTHPTPTDPHAVAKLDHARELAAIEAHASGMPTPDRVAEMLGILALAKRQTTGVARMAREA